MSKPNLIHVDKAIPSFQYWVQKSIPAVYDDSLSYYELLAKVIKHLNDIGELTNSMIDLWNEVTDWVMNDGLKESVQDKLDEYVDDGTLDRIINEHIFNDINDEIDLRTDYLYNPLEYRHLNTTWNDREDFSNAIHKAIEEASKNGGIVQIPAMELFYTQTIFVPEGVVLRGVSIPAIWTDTFKGSVLRYYGTGNAVEIGTPTGESSRNVEVNNLRIIDEAKTGKAGLVIGQEKSSGSSVDIKIEKVNIDGFDYGFMIQRAYGLTTNLCVSNNPRSIGWWFRARASDGTVGYGGLTLSTLQSSGVYGDENIIGFKIDRDVSYSAFQQCYVDGCRIGFEMLGYTRNPNLFQNCGVESYHEYGFYLSATQSNVGMSACFLTLPKSTVKDNVYFEGDRLHLSQMEFSYSYRPQNGGYDVNVASGTAYISNCYINSINGAYIGRPMNPNQMEYNPNAQNINAFEVEVRGENTTVNVTPRHSIIGTSINSEYSMRLSGGRQGQLLTIYGKSDEHKLRLLSSDFIGLGLTTYLGQGDYIRVMRTSDGWVVLDKSIDRYMSAPPTTGYWEIGRKIWSVNPSTRLGWVCIQSGTEPVWREFGQIDGE